MICLAAVCTAAVWQVPGARWSPSRKLSYTSGSALLPYVSSP
jgi:hypothetical protein